MIRKEKTIVQVYLKNRQICICTNLVEKKANEKVFENKRGNPFIFYMYANKQMCHTFFAKASPNSTFVWHIT